MSTGIYSIGVSGIAAAQLALLTTEHNVVNASTPGYTRQRTVQATNIAMNTGAGAIGQGVHVQTVERMYDSFMTAQINTSQAKLSEIGAYYGQIKQIDNLLADPSAGLSPALQDFFSGVQDVATNPASLSSRQAMISSAEVLSSRFQSMATRLEEMGAEVNGRIQVAVSSINSYSTQIAEVNQRIVISESSYGQPANDLLDQRDQLIGDLNKLIKVTTSENGDGSLNVFVGSGQQLVVGNQAMRMTAINSSADASKVVVGLQTAGTGSQELPESLITGGELGGLVRFRSETLGNATNELGRVAASVALTFNAQNALGQDLSGAVAGDTGFVGNLFSIPQPKVVANALNTGSGSIAATFSAPTAPTGPNYSGNFSTNLTSSDYEVKFGALGAFTVTRLSDNQMIPTVPSSGVGVVSFEGVTLNITVVGQNGDKFQIQPLKDVAGNIGIDSRIAADPRLIAAAAPTRVDLPIGNVGSMKMSQGVVGVGYDISGLPLTLTAAKATLPATGNVLQGVSAAWTATYSNGTTASGLAGAEINLLSGTETLASISFSGMSFEISGAPVVGDTFVIQRNTSGVQDGRNALLLGKLQTQNTVAGGTATFQTAYAELVSGNGVKTRELKVTGEAQQALLDQAEANRDALSGVNLDEEAANMIRFQQAYQASAKLLEVGKTLFDTILQLR